MLPRQTRWCLCLRLREAGGVLTCFFVKSPPSCRLRTGGDFFWGGRGFGVPPPGGCYFRLACPKVCAPNEPWH